MTCEDEQAFLDRHFETLQHVSEIPSRKGTGAQSTTRPSVVGPIGESVLDMGRNDDRRKVYSFIYVCIYNYLYFFFRMISKYPSVLLVTPVQ